MKPPRRWCLIPVSAALLLALVVPSASAGTAYVANGLGVALIDTAHNTVKEVDGSKEIKVGAAPRSIAITPDGKFAYVVNVASNGVSVIDTATNTVKEINGSREIAVGVSPVAIAITPDGKFAYVVNQGTVTGSGGVTVIETATNTVVDVHGSKEIAVGKLPAAIAITPDGKFAYVVNLGTGFAEPGGVSVIETASNDVKTIDGSKEIAVGVAPRGIAITPDGRFAYVSNRSSGSVSVIETATNQVLPLDGSREIKVGAIPSQVAITPDGRFAYVVVRGGAVAVIDVAQNRVVDLGGNPDILTGAPSQGIAIAPDGKFAYVVNGSPNEPTAGSVSLIDIAHNSLVDLGGSTKIAVGGVAVGVSIAPDQPPAAAFSSAVTRVRPGLPLTLDASASKDPDSPIASYAWSFGDGQSATLNSPKASHSFASPGTYTVSLKETDAENCSTAREEVFTGQTAMGCAGGGAAQVTKTITVAYPGVSVSCPKSARRAGCKFAVQAVAKAPARKPCRGLCKQPKAKAQSAVAKAKVRAGHSAIVSIVPKAAFNSQLAQAQSILVKETVLAKGKSKTRYVKLRVVQ